MTPPMMKGSARVRLKDLRTEPIEMIWPMSEPKTTIGPATSGEIVHAQKAIATSPKAKPLRPWTKPATAAPTTTKAAVASISENLRASPSGPRDARHSRQCTTEPLVVTERRLAAAVALASASDWATGQPSWMPNSMPEAKASPAPLLPLIASCGTRTDGLRVTDPSRAAATAPSGKWTTTSSAGPIATIAFAAASQAATSVTPVDDRLQSRRLPRPRCR